MASMESSNASISDDDTMDVTEASVQLLQSCAEGNEAGVESALHMGADVVCRDEEGRTPLHFAAGVGPLPIVKRLIEAGHPWNVVDDNYLCPGDYALQHGQQEIAEYLLEEGVRAEMLLGLVQKRKPGTAHGDVPTGASVNQNADVKMDTATTDSAGAVLTETKEQPAGGAYLQSAVRFAGDRIMDASNDAVMMEWETPLMQAHAELLCPTEKLDVLNVGFGMGIIDGFLQSHKPRSHHIIEAHPAVYARMKTLGWDQKPGVFIHFGRWQDVLPRLRKAGLSFDGIFFDTFDEYYEDMLDFERELSWLLRGSGVYSFFNGMAAGNRFFHAVYCRIAELDLANLGMTVQYDPMPVKIDPTTWTGVKHKYWCLDTYYLPACRHKAST